MFLISVNGKEYGVPESAKEITLTQYINFIKAIQRMEVSNNVYLNTLALGAVLAEFWGVELEDLGEFEAEPESTDEFLQGLNEIRQFNSIAGICARIKNIIDNYEHTPFVGEMTFEYKGVTWTIPGFKVSKYSEEYLRPPLKFAQVIRLAEAQRVAANHVGKKDKNGNDKDPEGSFLYSEMKATIAYLATNPDLDPGMNYQEKQLYFNDIDMATAIDVVFFLIDTLKA